MRIPVYARAALLMLVLLPWPGTAVAEARTYEFDPDHLFVTFRVEHAGYAHIIGRFMRARGRFMYDEENRSLESGTVTLFAHSVFTGHYQRDKLLRGPGFLNASEYPRIVFETSRFQRTGSRTGRLLGQLEMLGETRAVTLDVTINRVGPNPAAAGMLRPAPYVLGASARGTIVRSRWGMQGDARGGLLADEVELIIELEAHRQAE
ncbi:MAG: YceI family protein [Halofilum sp. (in: g-proteobacteria)]